jgi:hypothetical protein
MKGGDRRARRPGAVVLALLVGTTAVALALTLRYHLGVPGAVVTFVFGLPALYLGWIALQEARRPPEASLAQIADELAARLWHQWADEAKARGLNDPYPLPVAWTAADVPLQGDLDELKRLATSGVGWSASGRENWAKKPEDLAGGGDRKVADVLATVPTGRLVVLGEPGAGKTMLMVGLVLDLLRPGRRRSGEPVPVLASLASWDPDRQDLHGWLGAVLATDYPDLAGPPPPRSAGETRFEALVEAGLILPVLDGLDEIPETARPRAIARINNELKPGEQVVVTCRPEQYQAAVSPQNGPGVSLRAAAIQLRTLEFDEVARYLRTHAGTTAKSRWDFLDTLGAESPARQALTTPLMAGLARAIYNPHPADPDNWNERVGYLRRPAELQDFAAREAVEAHLFDAFIPAAYRPRTGGRWTARHAETWLVFLARHLDRATDGRPDLAWWQLWRAMPSSVFGWAVGLVVGLAAVLADGLMGWSSTRLLVSGLWYGLLAGLGIGYMMDRRAPRYVRGGLRRDLQADAPARGVRISVSGRGIPLAAGFRLRRTQLLALMALAIALQMSLVGYEAGHAAGLAAGLTTMVSVGLVVGLAAVPGNLARATSPQAVLARDRQAALLLLLVGGLTAWMTSGIAYWLAAGHAARLTRGLVYGLPIGLATGLVLSMVQTAWPSYMLTRGWLALRRRLPWSLMSFLTDAHKQAVLRQAGGVYQFRHWELQHRLAARPQTRSPSTSTSASEPVPHRWPDASTHLATAEDPANPA